MMQKTKIDWADYTVNPVKGLCPMACPYCYARRMYKRYKWNPEIRFDEKAWLKDKHAISILKKRSRIFVGSTFELFGDWVKPEWVAKTVEFAKEYPAHTFIYLTKQSQNLPIKWPDNCWVGVSATDNNMFWRGITYLKDILAQIKFVSVEPYLECIRPFASPESLNHAGISWVIIGQQTPASPKTAPQISWVKEIVEAADKAGVAVFLKNNLLELVNYESPETAFAFNKEGFYRQELPNT
jgi:protein gp37